MRQYITFATKEPLLFISYCLSALYWLYCHKKEETALPVIAKVGSTLLLACHYIQKNPEKHAINTALVAHCAGDLVIELPVKNAMLYAIPTFLAGHIATSHHLFQHRLPLKEISTSQMKKLVLFGLGSGLITYKIAENASGVLAYAIPFYAFALATLFILSFLQKQFSKPLAQSALLFILSDILIVSNKLLKIIPDFNHFTWGAYFKAQMDMAKYTHEQLEMPPCCARGSVDPSH